MSELAKKPVAKKFLNALTDTVMGRKNFIIAGDLPAILDLVAKLDNTTTESVFRELKELYDAGFVLIAPNIRPNSKIS